MATWRQPWLTLGCTKNKLQNSTCELFTLLTLHISPYLFIEVQTHSFNKHMLIYNTDVCLFNVCIHSLNKSLLNLLGARHGIIFTRVFSYAWYLSVSRYTVHPQEKTPCILPIVVGEGQLRRVFPFYSTCFYTDGSKAIAKCQCFH